MQFFLDETLLGEDTEAPFAIQFVTDNYPTGAHVFSAVGYTTDGKQLKSQTISAIFVSKEEGSTAALKMIVPILAVVFGAMAIAAISSDDSTCVEGKNFQLGRSAQLYIWRRNLPQMQASIWVPTC